MERSYPHCFHNCLWLLLLCSSRAEHLQQRRLASRFSNPKYLLPGCSQLEYGHSSLQSQCGQRHSRPNLRGSAVPPILPTPGVPGGVLVIEPHFKRQAGADAPACPGHLLNSATGYLHLHDSPKLSLVTIFSRKGTEKFL